MGIGSAVRHRLGRFEVPISELYRSCFINLDKLGAQLAKVTAPKRILEIGCGDGALAERLMGVYPDATYLGIDIAPTAGRLYHGDPGRAEFAVMNSSDLVAQAPEPFDMVVIVDVLHHIPAPVRPSILRDAANLMAPDGVLVVKEWECSRPVFGKIGYWADRYVTGDKDVDFMTRAQLIAQLGTALPEFEVVGEDWVRPWRENILLTLKRGPAA